MKKIFCSTTVALSILLLTGCFGEQSTASIDTAILLKCRSGTMQFLDTFECVNLGIDKAKLTLESDFNLRKDDIKICIGEEKFFELITINQSNFEFIEKSRPSIWSYFIPFVSPKNSSLSQMRELERSDEGIKLKQWRKELTDNLQESQKNCLRNKGINSLELVTRSF